MLKCEYDHHINSLMHIVTKPTDYIVSVNCTNFRDLSFNKLSGKVPNFGAMMALQYL